MNAAHDVRFSDSPDRRAAPPPCATIDVRPERPYRRTWVSLVSGPLCVAIRQAVFAVCLLAVAATVAAAGEAPEILVDVRPRRVYEGQPVVYSVTLNHVDNPSPPELKGFDDFDVQSLGSQSLDSTAITIINGRMTKVVRRGREYRFRLTPRKTGSLTIPAPKAVVNGKTLFGKTCQLEVIAANRQDTVRMAITVDRQAVYPMQPFTVTLAVLVKSLPPPFADENPLGVQNSPPALRIPWAIDDNLPADLQPKITWQEWLRPLQSHRRDGFSINDIGDSSVFSLFEDRTTRFAPRYRNVQRQDKNGKEVTYRQYDFSRTFVASKLGQYRFGPATLKGSFATGVNARGRLAGEAIYAVAQPIEVTVKDVPTTGRPDTYTGAIGRFQWHGDLKPKEARVGDPLTLTLTLTGAGTLASVAAPDLKRLPAIADHFKIYDATVETDSTSCQFTYTLRPKDEAIKAFPPVPMAYFDVTKERYRTLKTDSIPIHVTRAERLAEGQIVTGGRRRPAKPDELKSQRKGIFANVTDPKAAYDQTVHPLRWLAALGGLTGLYATMALATIAVRRVRGDPALLRRRAAPAKARRRLREARSELGAGRVRQGIEQIRLALCGLVADAAGVPEAGMTPKDARGLLAGMGVEPDLRARYARLLETCDAAQFSTSNQPPGAFGDAAEALLEMTIRELKARKQLR